jgi:FkbM family methyltransferase
MPTKDFVNWRIISVNLLSAGGLRSFIYHKLFPLRYPFRLIKVPTRNGWLTTFFYAGGLSYVLGRPSDKKIVEVIKLNEGDVVLDLGAHIGWYTLMMSRMVGDKGTVVSVEPNPINYAILCRNIKDNRLENVSAYQVALSDKNGYAEMSMSKNPTAHSLAYSTPNQTKTEKVKTMRLDTLMKQLDIGNIDFAKIDVEGAELKVLEGAPNTLKFGPDLIIESDNNPQRQRTLNFLRKHDYTVTWIDSENLYAKNWGSNL